MIDLIIKIYEKCTSWFSDEDTKIAKSKHNTKTYYTIKLRNGKYVIKRVFHLYNKGFGCLIHETGYFYESTLTGEYYYNSSIEEATIFETEEQVNNKIEELKNGND